MAKAYSGYANTPCCIIRQASALIADGPNLDLRVGEVGCTLPTGWPAGDGVPDNPVFFSKLVQAALRLIGSTDPTDLSGVNLAAPYFQAQPGNATLTASLTGSYPDGQFLAFPFFENVSSFTPIQDPDVPLTLLSNVIFENTGGATAPTYADLRVIVDNASANASFVLMVKLFHSLTV